MFSKLFCFCFLSGFPLNVIDFNWMDDGYDGFVLSNQIAWASWWILLAPRVSFASWWRTITATTGWKSASLRPTTRHPGTTTRSIYRDWWSILPCTTSSKCWAIVCGKDRWSKTPATASTTRKPWPYCGPSTEASPCAPASILMRSIGWTPTQTKTLKLFTKFAMPKSCNWLYPTIATVPTSAPSGLITELDRAAPPALSSDPSRKSWSPWIYAVHLPITSSTSSRYWGLLFIFTTGLADAS